jgi:hypothetical protein
MTFNITQFRSELKGGGARPNLFNVLLTFPAVAGNIDASRKLQFMIRSASLPPSTLGVIPVPFQGRQLPVAGDRTFEPWEISVLNDTDFLIRNAFESWSNAINEHTANTGLPAPSDYMVDAEVQQLGRDNTVLKTYDLNGIWPSTVGAIELSQDGNDTIEIFPVTLQLVEWTSNTTS